MKTWKSYKNTYRDEADIFDFARQGDLRGLADMLANGSHTASKPDVAFDINRPNSRGYSALMLAVYNGEKDFCEALLRFGADVNSTDFVGNTVLMASAFKGNIDIFTLLLKYGANIRLMNKSHMTVKDWALMFGRKKLLQFIDTHYPENIETSKLKSIYRFLKLGVITFTAKYSKEKQVQDHKHLIQNR